MKPWIKALDYNKIGKLMKQQDVWEEVPVNINRRILAKLKEIAGQKSKIKPFPSYIKYLAVAASLILVAFTVLGSYLISQSAAPKIVLYSGNGVLNRKQSISPLTKEHKIRKGDSLSVTAANYAILKVGNASYLKFFPETTVTFLEDNLQQIQIRLDAGELMGDFTGMHATFKFIVETPQAVTRLADSAFFISIDHGSTEVSLARGAAAHMEARTGTGTSFLVTEGQSIRFDGIMPIWLNTALDAEWMKLFDAGALATPSLQTVNSTDNGTDIAATPSASASPVYSLSVSIPTPAPSRIFTFSQVKIQEKQKILGIAAAGEYGVAVTSAGLAGFDALGNILWQSETKEPLYIDSIPVIYKNRIYAASIYKLIVMDLLTGKIISEINAPGILNWGWKMLLYKDRIYIPYPEGIYCFDPVSGSMDWNAVIQFANGNEPALIGDKLCITNFNSGQIALFDFQGRKIKETNLADLSLCPAVGAGNYIVAGDRNGRLYRYTEELNNPDTLQLPDAVAALAAGGGMLYALTGKGRLYAIDPVAFTLAGTGIPIDEKPSDKLYYYKKPFIYGNFLYIGTMTGIVRIFDVVTGKEAITRVIASSAISCTFASLGDWLFTGTEEGDIIRLKYR